MAAEKKATSAGNIKAIEQRWTKPLADAGWTAVPNTILDKQAALGLDSMDINIILQIAKFWRDSAPFPAVDTIGAAIGVQTRTVQRHITKMVKRGLLERQQRYYAKGGQKSNAYTFNGLIKRCTPFANEATKERERNKVGEKARIRRKSPLHIVRN